MGTRSSNNKDNTTTKGGTGITTRGDVFFCDVSDQVANGEYIDENQFKIENLKTIISKAIFQSYSQERMSEMASERWQQIDIVIAMFIAVTASGSAIAGWTLWSEPGWKYFWAFFAGIGSLASIAHGIMSVSSRIKDQENVRQIFCESRFDFEALQEDLDIGISDDHASRRYTEIRKKYSHCVKQTRPDIIFTKRFRKKGMELIKKELEEKGYIYE